MMKKVEITWSDTSASTGWYHRESLATQKCVVCKSIGYLVHKDKERVVLSGMMGDEEFNSIQYIPKGCIKEIRQIG